MTFLASLISSLIEKVVKWLSGFIIGKISEEIEIKEAFSYNFTPATKREIKKIIYQHFDLIVEEWSKHFEKK